jgi:tetratricopeptide (TPR) repeat protein
MSEGTRSTRPIRGALLLMALAGWASCRAQDASFNSDAADMAIRAQTCADERASPEDRIRACTVIVRNADLAGRDLANIYIYRARAARAAAHDEEAARDLDLAIKADDRYPIAYFERANFRASRGEKRQALEDYDQAIRLKGTSPGFFINRGNTYKDLGDKNAAVADYSKAIELDPKNALAWLNRSLVYAQLGKRDLAAQDRSQALRLDPTIAKSAPTPP